ncbi:unnamed protein product [Enterobius vermicularis]|uniref:Wsv293 n=1 Tax=Enterobius vermicularis TaxID=51028 RepID=A0A0N4VP61_ENTVE|nr:unnamed protein product [Enterobius vermicularis]
MECCILLCVVFLLRDRKQNPEVAKCKQDNSKASSSSSSVDDDDDGGDDDSDSDNNDDILDGVIVGDGKALVEVYIVLGMGLKTTQSFFAFYSS